MEPLFSDFKPVSFEEWKEKINTDLKGKKTFDDLIWHTDNQIDVLPAYHQDICPDKNRQIIAKKLNEFDKPNDWKIHFDIQLTTPEETNRKLIIALQSGVNSIEIKGNYNSYAQFKDTLKDIDLSIIATHFNTENTNETFHFLAQLCKERHYENEHIQCSIANPVNILSPDDFTVKSDIKQLFDLAEINNFENLKLFTIDVTEVHNSGGNTLQELVYGFAALTEILSLLQEIPAEKLAGRFRMVFATSTNYFFEIAKYRSIRIIWENLLEATQMPFAPLEILAVTSKLLQPEKDVETNILRHTTEAMSAVLGSADALRIYPFTSKDSYNEDFKERLAKNISLILKEESFFGEIADPSAGSYYIEELTNQLSVKTWQQLVDINNNSNYLTLLKNNTIKQQIEIQKQKFDKDIAEQKRILIGVNKYQNPNETN
jgi:methylmalonyl-CoA mutase